MAQSRGNILRSARRQVGMSQQKIADMLNISRITVTMWETDRAPVPHQHWDRIVNLLGLPYEAVPFAPGHDPRQVPAPSPQPRETAPAEPRQRAVTETWTQESQDAMRIDILENFVTQLDLELGSPKVNSPEDAPQRLSMVTGLLVDSRLDKGLNMTLAEARDYAEMMLGQLSARGWVKQLEMGWVLTKAGYDQFLRAWPQAAHYNPNVNAYFYPDLV